MPSYKWRVVAHAVVHLVLQLRRPPGDLLGLSAARTRDAPDAGPARAARVRVRVGLRARRAAGRHRRRPRPTQDGRSSAACTPGASSAWRRWCRATSRTCFCFARRRGSARRSTFRRRRRCISDYHGSLTRSRALGLHQTAVYMGTIGGGFFAGLIAEAYGWRLVVRGLRRTGRAARLRAHAVPRRAAARGAARSGLAESRPSQAAASLRRRTLGFGAFLRLVGAHADAPVPARRVHVRELRGGGAAVVDAEVPLRSVPHGTGDVRPDRDGLRAARQHGRRAGRRLARGRVAPSIAARTHGGADHRRAGRRAVRRAVRH